MAIRVLSKDISEKIAAGEVVERPVSAAKELIENSIDAGSTEIRVFLEEGGKKLLRIEDDGSGIPANELDIALQRHATSKIQEIDDLWKISTLGFRGEALPSIAAVSRFTIQSHGRKIYLEGGRVLEDVTSDDITPGTVVSVEDLFFNIPARLKFQKAKASEASAIRELIERLALTHPEIRFTLFSDGRKTLDLKGTGLKFSPKGNDYLLGLKLRFSDILGCKPDGLGAFELTYDKLHVEGFFDENGRAPNSRYLFLAVNGRMVRDKLMQQAVMTALRPRMMEGEFPRVFLELTLPPGDVDVNVHPAKAEVRFHKSKDVFSLIHAALNKLALQPTRAAYDRGESATEWKPTAVFSPRPSMAFSAPASSSGSIASVAPQESKPLFETAAVYKTKVFPEMTRAAAQVSSPDSSLFKKLHYIGQLKNTYLLFQDEQGLILIDQHAAHERINYEKIRAEFMTQGLQSQPLLISATLKCTAEDVAVALDFTEFFGKLGFEFEAFGTDCILIRSVPEGLQTTLILDFFRSILEELKQTDEAPEALLADPSRISAKLERVLATAACHTSVRAGQALSSFEAQKLSEQMEDTPSSLNCPHGRPASIRIGFEKIEDWFKR